LKEKKGYVDHKVFVTKQHIAEKWMYVQIKVLKILDKRNKEDYKLMVQIRDVSDRLLKQEMTAQKNVLTLINATVSHELRNPLSSIIG
jgi:signal transduction histidine kinase